MSDPLIRRYLLGDLPEADAQRFEEEYFASDDRFSEMLAVEDDLIEAFLHRRLSAGDRPRFEARFLSTERGRQKVALAALLEKASPVTARSTRWIPWSIAASVVVLAIGAGTLRELVSMKRQIEGLVRERAALRSGMAVVTADLQRLKASSAQPAPQRQNVFSIILRGGERGSASSAAIVLPRDAAAAELWLLLPRDEYPSYTAALQSIEGRTLWSEKSLTSRPLDGRKAILFRVPATSLQPRTYIVAVSGDRPDGSSEPVEDFSFSVRRP